jgi:hypothetical protein
LVDSPRRATFLHSTLAQTEALPPDDILLAVDPNLIERGPLIAEDDLSRFETRLGAALPPDYRRFLAATNGGRPPQNSIPHPDGNTGLIQRFS